MILVNGLTCYIFVLTSDESMAVHTDTGLRALEVTFVHALMSYRWNMFTLKVLQQTCIYKIPYGDSC